MYIEVLPDLTRIFFEGGEGFITNLVSGITKIVEAGQSSWADNQGNVSQPAETPIGERSQIGEGWNSDDDTEGYSSPENNDTSGIFGGAGSVNTGGVRNPEPGNRNSRLNSVPITDLVSLAGSATEPSSTLEFAGIAEGSFGYYAFVDLGMTRWPGEVLLYEIYNALYGTSYTSNDELEFYQNNILTGAGKFMTKEGKMYFVARYAGAKLNLVAYDEAGEYDIVRGLGYKWTYDTSRNIVYEAPADRWLALWAETTGYGMPRWYSKKELNEDGSHHFIILNAPGEFGDKALICFEDLSVDGDWDYNDLIIEVDGLASAYELENPFAFDYGTISLVFGGTGSFWGQNIPIGILGEFSNPDNYQLWGSDFNGTTSDGAELFGTVIGIKSEDDLEGLLLGFYIRPDGSVNRAGYIKSTDMDGQFVPETGLFAASGTISSYLDKSTSISPANLYSGSSYIDNGYSHGFIKGDLRGNIDVEVASLNDQNWGLWRAVSGGTYENNTGLSFRSAMAGGYDSMDHAWITTFTGEMKDARVHGSIEGILLYDKNDDGKLAAGKISGNAIGTYIDVDEDKGTWQAVNAGEWVEVTELFDPVKLGFDLTEFDNFVSVPITEVHTSILQGAGSFASGGAISAAMDMGLYANSPSANEGIWSAVVNGTYSGPTDNSWTAEVANGSDIAQLTGTLWENNNWLADVSGTVGGNAINGQAGGTFGEGQFSGVGAGTWNNQPE